MNSIWKDWGVGIVLVFALMALVSWSVYTGYNRLLHDQWRQEVSLRARHLTSDLEDAYSRLEVFGRCQLDRLSASDYTPGDPMEFDKELLSELDISEVTLRLAGEQNFSELYNRNRTKPIKVWRGSIFDIARSHQEQSVMEITEYGPRLAIQIPFSRGDETWVLEVAMKLDGVLEQFSRREGCQAALLIPQGRWSWGSGEVVKNAEGDTYVIAAATQPKAAELLSGAQVRDFIGREAYGLFQNKKADEAFGMLFMAGLEYQSSKAPVTGPTPSLVLWSDYGEVIAQLNSSRKGSLTVLWLTGGLFGGVVGYILWKLRRRSHKEFALAAAQDRRTIVMLQSELASRRKNEAALESASDALQRAREEDIKLMTGMAHRLKVCSSGIVGYTGVSEGGSMADKKEAYEEILEGAQHIFTEAENLDLWARRDEFGVAAQTKPVTIATALTAALSPLADWMRHKNIVLEETLDEKLQVQANEVLLTAILRNLLANAVKYSPNGGHIKLGVRQVQGGIELAIADEGEGLNPLQMEKVFEMPEELRTRGTAGEEGLGLGLRISYWACMAMGAQLNIFSGAGQGCRALILFRAV